MLFQRGLLTVNIRCMIKLETFNKAYGSYELSRCGIHRSIGKETVMNELIAIKVIAQMHCDFSTKFGIPRQSGLVKALKGTVVFAPEYPNPAAVA